MKQEVKSLGIMSVAKIYALIGLIIGIIYAALMALMGLFAMIGAGDSGGAALVMVIIMAVVVMIAAPIIYFILGALMAIIYNFFAKMVGGVEVELAEKK